MYNAKGEKKKEFIQKRIWEVHSDVRISDDSSVKRSSDETQPKIAHQKYKRLFQMLMIFLINL